MSETVNWNGTILYILDEHGCKDEAGIYVLAGLNKDGIWNGYYIGQAVNLKTRLASHDRWNEAVRLGATHIHAVLVPKQADRDNLERELIQYFQPPLNAQLKS